MLTRDVTLDLDGLKITGQLYLPGGQAPYPVVAICHGIPARIPDPAERGYPLLAERVCREGLAVFIFNFRGTGSSGGNFDMWGWPADLEAVIDFLWALPEVDRSHLALLGFSGGAAVSVCVAARDKRVSVVATCACPARFNLLTGDDINSFIERFRSIGIIRDKDFPHSVAEWLEGFRRVSPIDYVADIAPRPVLLIHGDKDEVVDVSQAYMLYRKAGEPRELVIINGAGHRLRLEERAMTAVIDWLKKWCRR
jgi:dipeptidyl aminopeptidase/acylaminoacyl peptidase